MHMRHIVLTVLPFAAGTAVAAETAAGPEEIPLWRTVAPGSEGKTAPEVVTVTDGVRRISSVHKPTISVYLPARDATGAAVIVVPGGAHKHLAIDNEGHAVARWLSEHGIAGFVLKYRLAREVGSTYKVEVHEVQDVQRALRLVRSRARKWNIDPARVGLLGFSAGGELVARASAQYDEGKVTASDPVDRESARPAFQALLYPGGGPGETAAIPKDAPPAFFLVASDDKNPTRNALAQFQKLRDAGINAELHLYAKGGHGFGMKDRPLPITTWPVRLREWLADQGFLQSRAVASP
jgi:endo-1,4-beta-xylanase